ncbi:IstB-like ATP binding protein [Marinobacter nauticus]|uniref:IstB-like ATP binding protein n=2 Tax=Marinobacter TaxID=2742 RepID=A0A368XGI8_MARNT|nr:ATP-binding protein [Marinobacter nauticus]RCW67111.1 IstB-like ATP binding protein [Marinobacter nauticus]|tara:strand:- start:4205 stop:4489 length:285 start_codon:yes stop_codon:yes gene_type:complete
MAAFPAEKRLEGFDYRHQTTITKRQVNALLDFQLINSLYEYRSIILTTNKDFTSWGEFFHDDNVAVPSIDRVIHHSHIFMLGGDSYRLKQKATS